MLRILHIRLRTLPVFQTCPEMFLMIIIPLSFPIAFAKLIGKWRGVSIMNTLY